MENKRAGDAVDFNTEETKQKPLATTVSRKKSKIFNRKNTVKKWKKNTV